MPTHQPPRWPMLPSDLGMYLTTCTSGKFFSIHAGNQFVERGAAPESRGREQLLAIGFDQLHQAWDTDPGDPTLAHQLINLDQTLGGILSPAKREAIISMGNTFRGPVSWRDRRGELLAQGGDAMRDAVEPELRAEPGNLHWWWQASECASEHNQWEWLLDMASTLPAGLCSVYAQRARADALFHLGRYAEAFEGYRQLTGAMEWPGLDLRVGECLLRSGDRAGAIALWRDSVLTKPWQTNLVLHLHDVLTGADAPGPAPDGQTFLLLYSWNKGESLNNTLASLAESDLSDARIKVLDNGSTDSTPDVVRVWAERFGADRFEALSTLVNVGAPAARNWLMHLPDVRQGDNVIYMDDDIYLPTDWLGSMGAAQRAYPEAAVWGCRVVDSTRPHIVQHADEFLGAPREEDNISVGFCCQCLDVLDYGQFSYMRPCTSVTGCLHMFRTAELHELGGFDLQFSPSQFDDAEHDLMLVSKGRTPVYQGHLRILHERNTGAQWNDRDKPYGIDGNYYKLNKKYSGDAVREIRTRSYATVLSDLRRKLAVIADQ
ncbi:glycosyltransferase family A protein [Desulfovibrio ferrophilus]|uniref:Glycosyl transferase family 2 n=1 Tax=Desulfovibrio ferrophilus TaxID=241368 RepID=A0A2Z6B1D8_9BACT|nr:glycosyltransferase family A protein [Desulfovibrio ferrophilus]BBD09291.1 glycosyl transferase family 2 [Desulfovibrio ferrophilus]